MLFRALFQSYRITEIGSSQFFLGFEASGFIPEYLISTYFNKQILLNTCMLQLNYKKKP